MNIAHFCKVAAATGATLTLNNASPSQAFIGHPIPSDKFPGPRISHQDHSISHSVHQIFNHRTSGGIKLQSTNHKAGNDDFDAEDSASKKPDFTDFFSMLSELDEPSSPFGITSPMEQLVIWNDAQFLLSSLSTEKQHIFKNVWLDMLNATFSLDSKQATNNFREIFENSFRHTIFLLQQDMTEHSLNKLFSWIYENNLLSEDTRRLDDVLETFHSTLLNIESKKQFVPKSEHHLLDSGKNWINKLTVYAFNHKAPPSHVIEMLHSIDMKLTSFEKGSFEQLPALTPSRDTTLDQFMTIKKSLNEAVARLDWAQHPILADNREDGPTTTLARLTLIHMIAVGDAFVDIPSSIIQSSLEALTPSLSATQMLKIFELANNYPPSQHAENVINLISNVAFFHNAITEEGKPYLDHILGRLRIFLAWVDIQPRPDDLNTFLDNPLVIKEFNPTDSRVFVDRGVAFCAAVLNFLGYLLSEEGNVIFTKELIQSGVAFTEAGYSAQAASGIFDLGYDNQDCPIADKTSLISQILEKTIKLATPYEYEYNQAEATVIQACRYLKSTRTGLEGLSLMLDGISDSQKSHSTKPLLEAFKSIKEISENRDIKTQHRMLQLIKTLGELDPIFLGIV